MLLLVAIAGVLAAFALGVAYLIRACVVAVLELAEWIWRLLRGNKGGCHVGDKKRKDH